MRIKKGFTLIELLIVISIIGILASIIMPAVRGMTDKAKVAKILTTVQTLDVGAAAYFDDIGSLPTYEYDYRYEPQTSYHHLSANQGGRWAGPYIKEPLNWEDNVVDGDIDAAPWSIFDLDRNGAVDTNAFCVCYQNVPESMSQLVDQKVDGYASSGENWRNSGRVMHGNCWFGSLTIAVYW